MRGLVESAGLGPDSLVLDLGAGPGTLTAPLARAGARVLAVERDPSSSPGWSAGSAPIRRSGWWPATW
ncbi:hypothetical protein ACWDWO_08190 [Actinopolymorpha singaporensis]